MDTFVASISCWCLVTKLPPTSLTAACQAPLSMGFPRQEYWGGLPFPSLEYLPNLRSNLLLLLGRRIVYHWATRKAPSISWLLRVMLQWTWECRELSKIVLMFPLGICTKVKLMGHVVVPFLIFLRKFSACFHRGYTNLEFHQQLYKCSLSSSSILVYLLISIIAILIGLRW